MREPGGLDFFFLVFFWHLDGSWLKYWLPQIPSGQPVARVAESVEVEKERGSREAAAYEEPLWLRRFSKFHCDSHASTAAPLYLI